MNAGAISGPVSSFSLLQCAVQPSQGSRWLQVMLKALQDGHSVMFYCKAGKDRTGIVAALLLSVAGASEEQIIEDYHMCASAPQR